MAQISRMASQNIQPIPQNIKSAIFSISKKKKKNSINEILSKIFITLQKKTTEAENKLEKTLKIIGKSLHL